MECPECGHAADEDAFTDFDEDGRYPDWVLFVCPECGELGGDE